MIPNDHSAHPGNIRPSNGSADEFVRTPVYHFSPFTFIRAFFTPARASRSLLHKANDFPGNFRSLILRKKMVRVVKNVNALRRHPQVAGELFG